MLKKRYYLFFLTLNYWNLQNKIVENAKQNSRKTQNKIAEENLIKFNKVIREHNEKARLNEAHPGIEYREPSLLIIICGNAPMAYTTENGVKVIPVGCLKD